MTVQAAIDVAQVRELDLAAERNEVKFLLPATQAASFALGSSERLPAQRGAPEQELTTVYFDTEGCELYRAALAQPIAIKVRIRAYGAAPAVYVELKVREGQRSRKSRVQLPVDAAISLVERPELAVAYDLLGADGAAFHGVADELRRVCAGLSGRLRASCAVRYRRRAFEEPALALRVTIDRELRAFAPDPAAELFSSCRDEQPAFAEPACVVEIKSRGGWPPWLPSLLAAHGALPVEYSKFVMASRAVHGILR